MTPQHRSNKELIESISNINDRREYIKACALDEINTQILFLRHVKFKNFDYIADTVGISVAQLRRRYKYSIQILSDVIRNSKYNNEN